MAESQLHQLMKFLGLWFVVTGLCMWVNFSPLRAQSAATNRVLELNGNGSYVELPPTLLKGITEATIELWVKPFSLGNGSRFFEFGGREGDRCESLAVGVLGGTDGLRVVQHRLPGRGHQVTIPNLIRANQWSHLAIVASQRGLSVYWNGYLVAEDGYRVDFDGVNRIPKHFLGKSMFAGDKDFAGQMDEVRLWRVARTGEQIRAEMFQHLTGKEEGLAACWNFDEGDVRDSTPGQHLGHLSGGAKCGVARVPSLADIAQPAIVRGRVHSETGEVVSAIEASLRQDGVTVALNLLSVFDSSYEFVLFNPNERTYAITVTSGAQAVTRPVQLHPGQMQELELSFGDPGGVTGTLRMFDGTPHVAVPVQLINSSNAVIATVLSDTSGRFSFTNVPPASYQIRCHVRGGFRYLGADGIVTAEELNSRSGLHSTSRVRVNPGQISENADFTFAPFKKGTWRTFTKRDGLAANEVRKILPLDDGTLWIGTMGGVSIFDGVGFRNLHKEDGLPDNRILNLYHDRRGSIWICTGNGVARYDPSAPVGKRMHSYTSADGLFPGEVHAVCQTPDDAMWFAYRGISRFDGREFKTLTTTNREAVEGHIMKMTASPDGTIWLGGILGLGRFDPTSFTAVLEVADPAKCDSPVVRSDGTIWFVSHDAGLHRFNPAASRSDPGRLRKFGRENGILREGGLTIHFTPDGALWMGSHGGVCRFDGTNSVNFLPEDGFAGTPVIFISSTPDDVLWFAAGAAGLARYDPHSFETYTVADGLASSRVAGACRLPDGSLWFGSDIGPSRSSGLNRYAEGSFFETPLPGGDRGSIVRMRVVASSLLLTGEFERSSAYRLESSRLIPAFMIVPDHTKTVTGQTLFGGENLGAILFQTACARLGTSHPKPPFLIEFQAHGSFQRMLRQGIGFLEVTLRPGRSGFSLGPCLP